MGFFDFESAERAELNTQPIQGHGDTLRALLDHRWLNFAVIIFFIIIRYRACLPAVNDSGEG